MTAPVTTWAARKRHYPNPQRPVRTLCGRRIDDTTTLTPDRIAELPACGRCQKASTTA